MAAGSPAGQGATAEGESVSLTRDDLVAVMPLAASVADTVVDALAGAARRFEIDTPSRQAALEQPEDHAAAHRPTRRSDDRAPRAPLARNGLRPSDVGAVPRVAGVREARAALFGPRPTVVV